MKTQLLYLDAHDDLASTREKLHWVQADRVVLVWPSHGRILHRRLDLVLLSREAERQAGRLGVLSHDPDVRDHARQLGLPVFDDLDAVSRQPWPDKVARPTLSPPEPKTDPLPPRPARSTTPRHRRWTDAQRAVSMLVVIAALLGLSIVIGPAALIELSPTQRDQVVEFPLDLGGVSAQPSGTASIPSRILQVEVEGALQVSTSGTVRSPTTAATGSATFTNMGEAEVILPEATGLRTLGSQPQRFETTERALVPAGIGSQVLVPIRASVAGPEGNVPAEAIAAVEGTLGLQLTVANREATTGGAAESLPGVTQADVAAARLALERQLLQQANAQLQNMLAEGETLAPASVTIRQVLASEIHPDVGEPSEVVRGIMKARVEATAFTLASLEETGLSRIEAFAGPDQEIVRDTVRVELVPVEPAGFAARVRGRSRARVDFGPVAQAIAGKPLATAAAILADELDLASPPEFSLWPGWWPRMPLLPLRIQPVWVAGRP